MICIELENVKKLKVLFFLLAFYYWSWGHKALARHYGPYPHLNATPGKGQWLFNGGGDSGAKVV